MTLGHVGMAVFIVGITLTSLYSTEKDVRLAPGDSYEMGGYRFQFEGVQRFDGPNYIASAGRVTVTRDGELVKVMQPEKRIYQVQRQPMTEAAIDAGITRDLFVALGEQLDEAGGWSVRLYVKPYIRWIWLGAIIMALGGLVAATDRRYRMAVRQTAKLPAGSASAGAG